MSSGHDILGLTIRAYCIKHQQEYTISPGELGYDAFLCKTGSIRVTTVVPARILKCPKCMEEEQQQREKAIENRIKTEGRH